MPIIKTGLHFITDLFFPKTCLGCDKEGFWICPGCLSKIKTFDSFQCPVCQKRLPARIATQSVAGGPDGKICQECRAKTRLSRFFAAFSYEDSFVKNAIHKLKYGFIKNLALPLSAPTINFLTNLDIDFSDFLIVPVPLYKSRERWRGFNQSKEMAREISRAIKISCVFDNLVKTKNTRPQVGINDYKKRKENVKGAFGVEKPEIFSGKKIILVDDIYTTGATMEECTKILRQSGVKEVWGIVVAR